MTPRPDIVAVKVDTSLAELRELFVDQQYSRLPVYEESLDNILGFVFVKDLVALAGAVPADRVITELMRPAYVVPEAKRVAELLKEFQRKRVQSAIVHDEYGGTAGLVTIEDLLEEIVGRSGTSTTWRSSRSSMRAAAASCSLGPWPWTTSPSPSTSTSNGAGSRRSAAICWRVSAECPKVGEILDIDEVSVEILEGERRRVQRVRMRRRPPGPTHATTQAGH